MHKDYLIVLNPLPNKQKKYWLGWIIQQLKQHHQQYYIYTTSKVLSDNQLFFKQQLAKFDEVLVLGGDGTLHLLANCMAYAKQPIAVFPCGTGNDFMRNFAYSKHQLQQLLFSDKSQQIDLGKVNDRYFINSAGIGFDAEIVEKTIGNKGLLARFSYLYHAISSLFLFKETALQMTDNTRSEALNYENFLTVFANGQFFGGGMHIAPEAKLNSNQLMRYSVEKTHILKKLWALTQIYSGKHTRLKEVSSRAFTQLQISNQRLPIQADGELAGYTPAVVSVAKNALNIKVP